MPVAWRAICDELVDFKAPTRRDGEKKNSGVAMQAMPQSRGERKERKKQSVCETAEKIGKTSRRLINGADRTDGRDKKGGRG